MRGPAVHALTRLDGRSLSAHEPRAHAIERVRVDPELADDRAVDLVGRSPGTDQEHGDEFGVILSCRPARRRELAKQAARKNLTDFDRYKVMVARTKRKALIAKALA